MSNLTHFVSGETDPCVKVKNGQDSRREFWFFKGSPKYGQEFRGSSDVDSHIEVLVWVHIYIEYSKLPTKYKLMIELINREN